MKHLKSLFLAALSAVLVAPLLRADDTPPPPHHQGGPGMSKKMREHRLKMLDEALKLTAEQKTQINAIWDQAEAKAEALRADTSLSQDDRRAKMRAIMDESQTQVRAVLTADQQKIFDAMPKMGPRGGPGRDGERPPPPPEQ